MFYITTIPPDSTRTARLFPDTPLFRAAQCPGRLGAGTAGHVPVHRVRDRADRAGAVRDQPALGAGFPQERLKPLLQEQARAGFGPASAREEVAVDPQLHRPAALRTHPHAERPRARGAPPAAAGVGHDTFPPTRSTYPPPTFPTPHT